MTKKIIDPDPHFEPGEIIKDRFIFEEGYLSAIKAKRVKLLCTLCGTHITCKESDAISGRIRCKSCQAANYKKTVESAEAISHRICRGCGKLLPKEKFRPRIGCKNYINPWCRECEVAKFKYPENLIDPVTDLKRCASCKKLLPRKSFCAHPYNPDGLKSWCETCNQKHYHESLVKRGLRLPDEEIAREKAAKAAEKALKAKEKALQDEEDRKERKLAREAERAAFKRDRDRFYEDELNKGKQYAFIFWRKGYYN